MICRKREDSTKGQVRVLAAVKVRRVVAAVVLCVAIIGCRAAFADVAVPGAVADSGGLVYFDLTAGDAGRAPDITTLVVSQKARRKVQFVFVFLNRSGKLKRGDDLTIYVDSDRNQQTGYDPGPTFTKRGFDYVIDANGSRRETLLAEWKPSPAPGRWIRSGARVQTAWDDFKLTVTVPASALGETQVLDFKVLTRVTAQWRTQFDNVPNVGTLRYSFGQSRSLVFGR